MDRRTFLKSVAASLGMGAAWQLRAQVPDLAVLDVAGQDAHDVVAMDTLDIPLSVLTASARSCGTCGYRECTMGLENCLSWAPEFNCLTCGQRGMCTVRRDCSRSWIPSSCPERKRRHPRPHIDKIYENGSDPLERVFRNATYRIGFSNFGNKNCFFGLNNEYGHSFCIWALDMLESELSSDETITFWGNVSTAFIERSEAYIIRVTGALLLPDRMITGNPDVPLEINSPNLDWKGKCQLLHCSFPLDDDKCEKLGFRLVEYVFVGYGDWLKER